MSLNTCFGIHCVAGAHFGETVSCVWDLHQHFPTKR